MKYDWIENEKCEICSKKAVVSSNHILGEIGKFNFLCDDCLRWFAEFVESENFELLSARFSSTSSTELNLAKKMVEHRVMYLRSKGLDARFPKNE